VSAEGGSKAIVAALAANLGIAVAKFVAFAFTGSASMMAEGVHSIADSGNQGLLILGRNRSKRAETSKHPFGYGRERFFYAFIVAVVLFTVGAILSFAISKSPSGFNIQTVGVIFMLVGVVWVVAAILLYRNQRRATVITERREVPGAAGEDYIEERRSYGEPDPRGRLWGSGAETTPYAEPQSAVPPEATESGYEPAPAPYETDESSRPLWPGGRED